VSGGLCLRKATIEVGCTVLEAGHNAEVGRIAVVGRVVNSG